MVDEPEDKIKLALSSADRHLSVDAPFGEDEDGSLLDVLPDNNIKATDGQLLSESLATEIDRALQTLSQREREIVKSSFGIGCVQMSLEEIGEKYDLTRERVRQINEKALRHLRQSERCKNLKAFLGN